MFQEYSALNEDLKEKEIVDHPLSQHYPILEWQV